MQIVESLPDLWCPVIAGTGLVLFGTGVGLWKRSQTISWSLFGGSGLVTATSGILLALADDGDGDRLGIGESFALVGLLVSFVAIMELQKQRGATYWILWPLTILMSFIPLLLPKPALFLSEDENFISGLCGAVGLLLIVLGPWFMRFSGGVVTRGALLFMSIPFALANLSLLSSNL